MQTLIGRRDCIEVSSMSCQAYAHVAFAELRGGHFGGDGTYDQRYAGGFRQGVEILYGFDAEDDCFECRSSSGRLGLWGASSAWRELFGSAKRVPSTVRSSLRS